jgi:DNA-binding NtrC family response regulator
VDGGSALALCEGQEQKFDLVITDVSAPGMSGEDLMGYFAVKYPNLIVIHMSGFPRSHLNGTNAALKQSFFLSKPFTTKQLTEIVDRALDSANLEK